MITSDEELDLARRQALRLEGIIRELRTRLSDRDLLADEMVRAYSTRLQSVRMDIDSFLGVGPPRDADLVLRVQSPDIDSEGAPSTILVDTLEKLRKAITSSYARVSRGMIVGPGRIPDDLRVASEPRVLWLAPGSLRIGIDLPASYHQRTVEMWATDSLDRPEYSPIQRSVALLLAAAAWASSDRPITEIERSIPDPGTRKAILEQIRQLSPSAKGRVSSLGIEGNPRIVDRPILLTSSARERAREAAYPGSKTEEFEDTGLLKKVSVDIDKEEHLFELRDRPDKEAPLRGDFPEELRARVFDAIHRKYRVKVRGILETRVGQHAKKLLHLEEFERTAVEW